MAHDTLFVGLDVHKDSITAACVGTDPAALPVDLGTFPVQMGWHVRYRHDPAHSWSRSLIGEVAKKVSGVRSAR